MYHKYTGFIFVLKKYDYIRNIHRNARYTIAMVPKVRIRKPEQDSAHQDIQYISRARDTDMHVICNS